MGLFGHDTSPEAAELLLELTRRQGTDRRLEQAFDLIEMTRAFAFAGLRMRHPEASERELRERYAALVLDRETVRRVYGWDPAERGYVWTKKP
jgi:hypothetical protein